MTPTLSTRLAARWPASRWIPVALAFWLAPWTVPGVPMVDGFDPAKIASMEAAVQQAIAEHRLPGGVLWVEHHEGQYHKAFGLRAVAPCFEPMTEDTIFDVASLTKVLATTPALMVLLERGKVKLDEPISTYLPEFARGTNEAMLLRHLLTHTSGFGRTLSRGPDWSDLHSALALAGAEKLPHAPGSVFQYSDLNFILLGEIVQRVAGETLDAFVAREIFRPLKMTDTGFRPAVAQRPRIAPTDRVGNANLRGTVHDPKAQLMEGVAGHAGVFTTAADMARFARMLLRGGELEGVRILKSETVKLMTSVQTPSTMPGRRGLGWDIDSDFSRPRGDRFPLGSFGHTGFTGVCLWVDPYSQTFWLFLSNRVHPDPSGNIYALQRTLANLAAEAVVGFSFTNVPGALAAPPARRTPE